MASFSSCPPHPKIKYDLFISFRGQDTRHGFLSHLIKDLRREKIDVYEDERLERGEEILQELHKAIESSMILLVLLSKNYASSTWCLDELMKIFECRKRYKRIVIPVFYNINPSDVRHQTGIYGDAFAKHEIRFEENVAKVRNWRYALKEAANLSGFHLSLNFEKETQLIGKIVKDVLQKLNNIYPISESSNMLVGIHERIADLDPKLSSCNNNVHVIGIWGMGGIGKTTIAKALFHRLLSKYEFEGWYFLENVREKLDKYGLTPLQNEIFSVLLEKTNQRFGMPMIECTYNRARLHRRRVLLVLDDVNDKIKSSDLYAGHDWFGQGSIIIVTSRDKQVLINNEADFVYEVLALSVTDSLQLFSSHAFKEKYPTMSWEKELSMKAVHYAKGNPLAIEVLGSSLRGKRKEVWESRFEKLRKMFDSRIMNILKLSYDELDSADQEIFLYLACFFKRNGVAFDYIKLLDACRYSTIAGLSNLLDKALLMVKKGFRCWDLDMHDLIQEMGLEIVRREFKDPRQRRHLWEPHDICQVLRTITGTEAIQSLSLNISNESKELHLSPKAFDGMVHLKFLYLGESYHIERYSGIERRLHINSRQRKIYLQEGYLESLPNGLRLLKWDKCPLKFLPSRFCMENLVELHLVDSRLEKLWDGVQDLVNLITIDLSFSKHLMELPDFSKALNLQWVNLYGCVRLCYLHPSLLSLHKIIWIDVSYCIQLKSLRSEVCLRSLTMLYAENCSNLEEFSVTSESMVDLNLYGTAIKEIPSLVLPHRKLEVMKGQLSTILHDLENLDFSHICYSYLSGPIRNLLCEIGSCGLETLTWLKLSESNIESLPTTIKHCSHLDILYLDNCKSLRSLPELPPSITRLFVSNCESLERSLNWSVEPRSFGWYWISFVDCIKLNKESLDRIMTCAYVMMKHSAYVQQLKLDAEEDDQYCYKEIWVWLPGSKLPDWDGLISTTEASMTLELASSSNLMGFICCCVLSRCKLRRVRWTCNFETSNGRTEIVTLSNHNGYGIHSSRADIVLLAFSTGFPLGIMNEIRKSRDNNQYSTNKVSFECFVENIETYTQKEIIEWGVLPIYASDYFTFGQHLGYRQIDDFDLLNYHSPQPKI